MDYATLSVEDGGRSADVSHIATDLAGIYGEEWARQGIALDLALSDGAEVRGAPERIHSVLQNLLLNARDAIVETGRDRGRIRLRVERAGPETVIEVADDGVGIDADLLERIFEPFFSTKPHRGMGLGLSACRKIVAGCGGRMEVQSDAGGGATFRLLFPSAAVRDPQSG
nr:HAMP domain-containing sensor histidine kinase [Desulfatitalea alkaliphila]